MRFFLDFIFDLQDRFNAYWDQFSSSEKWIISVAVLLILVAIAYYVIQWLRGLAYQEIESPDVFLTDFQQLKAEGKLSEDEFSKVKKSAIHATAETLSSVAPSTVSSKFVGAEKEEGGSDLRVPGVTPSSAPPITLAEALARKNAEANNSIDQESED